jgi:hypothetical protein
MNLDFIWHTNIADSMCTAPQQTSLLYAY